MIIHKGFPSLGVNNYQNYVASNSVSTYCTLFIYFILFILFSEQQNLTLMASHQYYANA